MVTARAGTPLAELEAVLAEQGQCLPFEPPHFGGGATVGGMVAAGLSGPARASAGAVRDYVLGVTLVNGRGELLIFGGQVMKNVAGYDVSRLVAGSLGTLGLIAEVSLKVLPVAPGRSHAGIRDEPGRSAAAAERVGRPAAAAERQLLGRRRAARATLYLRLRGAVAAVEAACTHAGRRAPGQRRGGAGLELVPRPAPALVRRARRRATCGACRCRRPRRCSTCPEPPLIEWHGGAALGARRARRRAALARAAARAGGHATLFMRPRATADSAARPVRRPGARRWSASIAS